MNLIPLEIHHKSAIDCLRLGLHLEFPLSQVKLVDF